MTDTNLLLIKAVPNASSDKIIGVLIIGFITMLILGSCYF